MKKAIGISVVLMLLLLGVVAAEIVAEQVPFEPDKPDFSSPVVVHRPLIVTPGEPVMVPVYNGGHGLWSDLAVSVADSPIGVSRDLVGAEEFTDVAVNVPLIYLLDAEELPVSLYYQGDLLDTRTLPVEVVWPEQVVVGDPVAPGGPELVVLVDATRFGRILGGVQVEISVLRDGEEVFFDFYGPFYLSPTEHFVWRTPLPERYLSPGDYEVRATFYEGDRFLAETTSSFRYGDRGQVSFGPILLLILSVLLLVLIYVIMDMLYHGREFSETWSRLRE